MAIFVGPSSGVQTSAFYAGGTGAFVAVGSTTTTGQAAGINTLKGAVVYNETDGELQYYTGDLPNDGWIGISSATTMSSSGGTKDTTSRAGYTLHTFTTPGNFEMGYPSPLPDCEYVIIGGGGCGGDYYGPNPGYNSAGGGGGAGGMKSGTLALAPATFAVTVGEGGQSSVTSISDPTDNWGVSGTPSTAAFPTGTVTAYGGGHGAMGNTDGVPAPQFGEGNCSPGGSGGGGARDGSMQTGGEGNMQTGTTTAAPGQGNDGANYSGPDGHGAGGGGAGGTASPWMEGGDGSATSITGSSVTHAGGGGGGAGNNPSDPSPGGSGGGGAGGADPGVPAPARAGGAASSTGPGANYGAGGGGAGRGTNTPAPMSPGGNANDGIVIIAIKNP